MKKLIMKPVEVYNTKTHCKHGYDLKKRVNDISINGKEFRQVNCKVCGKYKYPIDITNYHPLLLNELIIIKP